VKPNLLAPILLRGPAATTVGSLSRRNQLDDELL
jgi:hypothetical protein